MRFAPVFATLVFAIMPSQLALFMPIPAGASDAKMGQTVRQASDSEIAAVIAAANEVDLNAGNLALQKSASPQVKSFANQIVTDQGAVKAGLDHWAKKSKHRPEENLYSMILKQGGLSAVERLKGLNGDAFDRAYASAEADYQQKVLHAVDQLLLPNCTDQSLKKLLSQARPKIARHADAAKKLREQLAASNS